MVVYIVQHDNGNLEGVYSSKELAEKHCGVDEYVRSYQVNEI